MKYLFIGGPEDGLRMETDGQHSFEFTLLSRSPSFGEMVDIRTVTAQRVRYVLVRVCGSAFYVFQDMETGEAIEELVRRYPEPSKEWRLR